MAYEVRISDWSSDVCSSDLRTGGNTGDPAVVGVELEQERIVDRTRDQHRLALVRQRIHDPVEVAVRDRDPAGAVDVRAVHFAQADLEVETHGLEARLVQIGSAPCRERVCEYV